MQCKVPTWKLFIVWTTLLSLIPTVFLFYLYQLAIVYAVYAKYVQNINPNFSDSYFCFFGSQN